MLRKNHIRTQDLKYNAETPHAHKVEDVYRLLSKHLHPVQTGFAITDGQSKIINVAHGTDATRLRVRYGKLWLEVHVLVLLYVGCFRLLAMFIQSTHPYCFLNIIIDRLFVELWCFFQSVMQTFKHNMRRIFCLVLNWERCSSLATILLQLSPRK